MFALAPSAQAACNGFPPTPAQIGGTHFKASPRRHSVVEPGMKGTRITLSGYVLTAGCKAVRGARIDFWQADANGVYDDRGTRLRSHQFTDAQGRYKLATIIPGPYSNRTPHVHTTVRAPGLRTVTTMLYFPGAARNASDPFFDRRLLVRLRQVGHRFVARFDFVLRKRTRAGHQLAASTAGGGSAARDRITIAAAVTAVVALIAGLVLFRRGRRGRPD